MKKIYTAIIALTITLFGAVTVSHAWDINNSDYGISFTLSNNWQEAASYNTINFYNTHDNDENMSIGSIPLDPRLLTEASMLEVFENVYSNADIAEDLTTTNGINVNIKTLSQRHEYVTYNGIDYFNVIKEYSASAYNYHDAYGIKSVFFTYQNGNLYFIEYALFENDQATMGSRYYNSEVFKVLGSLSYDLGKIKIVIDGARIYPDSDPIIIDGRTLVPIRAVAEKMGYTVGWDAENQIVSLVNPDNMLHFQIDTNVALRNIETEIPLDVAPMIINNRTYLPLRAVTEAMDASVNWESNTKTVIINS